MFSRSVFFVVASIQELHSREPSCNRGGGRPIESQRPKVQRIEESIDDANQRVPADIFVDSRREQAWLMPINTLEVSHGETHSCF
jgi:hypothetical protein